MLDLHTLDFLTLKDEDCDSKAIRKEYFRQECKIVVGHLEKNNFEAHYCDSIAVERPPKLAPVSK